MTSPRRRYQCDQAVKYEKSKRAMRELHKQSVFLQVRIWRDRGLAKDFRIDRVFGHTRERGQQLPLHMNSTRPRIIFAISGHPIPLNP